MKRVDISVDQIDKFAGFWVVIDPVKRRIIANGKDLEDISSLVVHSTKDKTLKPAGKAPYSFLVPRKDEGPYIL